MPFSFGGSWQNQDTEGGSTGTNQQDSTYDSSGYVTPTAPGGYQDYWNRINPGGGTEGVQGAADYFKARSNPGETGSSYTLATLAQNWPELYSEIDPVQAQEISAKRGIEFSKDYQDQYGTGVLDPALADYDYGVGGAANAFRLGDLGAGGGGSRSSVAAAEMAGQAARGRGALSAGIRSDILDKSFGFGGQDASRFLTADATNASNALQAGMFNNTLENQRQMFDVDAAYRGAAMRDAAANAAGNFSNLGYNQGLDWLGAGNPLIGQQSGQSGTDSTTGTNTSDFWSNIRSSGKQAGIGK